MKDSITIKHSLPYFEVTKEPVLVTTINNKQMFITEGISTKATATVCPVCGHVLHCNGTNVRSIRDIDLLGHHSLIRVKLKRMKCLLQLFINAGSWIRGGASQDHAKTL